MKDSGFVCMYVFMRVHGCESLQIEPRALFILDKCSTELHPERTQLLPTQMISG